MLKVPVISSSGKPLMPCHPARARELVRKNKAVRRFNKGIFYIQLLNRNDGKLQDIAVGIDPGSKKEAFTVKSEAHTYLNLQVDAVTWVKEAVEVRRNMRRSRRFRKTPCRKNKTNRAVLCKSDKIPPSTRARWNLKLRIINILRKIYPIITYVVEDIRARTKEGKRAWNASFSPLEQGKKYFYDIVKQYGELILKSGYDTYEMRNGAGLSKTKEKLSEVFEAHCVDSWVLANSYIGGHIRPENKDILYMTPLRFHRRQLHVMQPGKGGIRRQYGSTRSIDFTRGSLVKHKKHSICYIGGSSIIRNKYERISLHSTNSGERICQNAKIEDVKFLCYNSFRLRSYPLPKGRGL